MQFDLNCMTATNKDRQTLFNDANLFILGNEMGKGAYCHCTPSAERPFVHFKSTFTPQCSLSRKWALCAYCIHSVWALREMDDALFGGQFTLEAIAKCKSADLNALKVNLSAVIRV